jgi:glycosyltransferase involved in cell wall biosynthesis
MNKVMKLPNISIGIPVYNQSGTIASTIESVLKQTNIPFEIVISENHSTDGTKEIVENFSDRLRIVRPPRHLTMSENWDFCVKSCKGDWVGLISGDDILLPNYIESMQKGILKNLEAVFIMGGWQIVHAVTEKTTNKVLLSMSQLTYPPATTKMLLSGPKASFAAFCFKKSTYIEIGGYDQRFQLIQDWILQFDLSFKGNFIKIDDLVAKYYSYERDELETKRVPLYIKDFLLYLNSKIWRSHKAGISKNEIKKNGRKVIVSLLNRIIVHGYTCSESEFKEIQDTCVKFDSINIYNKWVLNKNDIIQLDNYFKRKVFFLMRKVYSQLKNFSK